MVGVSPFKGRLTTDQVKKFSAEAGNRATPCVDATKEIAIAKLSISRCGVSSIPVRFIVAPGPTDTSMLTRFTGTPEKKAALVTTVPMGRLGLTEELANAIVFIALDEASFINGHILNVDGGKSH